MLSIGAVGTFGGVMWLRVSGARALELEYESLRSAGIPLEAHDLPPVAERGGVSPETWWPKRSGASTSTPLASLGYVTTPLHFGFHAAPTDSPPLPPGHALYSSLPCDTLFQRLHEDERAFWAFLEESTADPVTNAEWIECAGLAYQTFAAADPAALERALAACKVAQRNAHDGWNQVARDASTVAQVDQSHAEALRILRAFAFAEAFAGRADTVMQALEASFCVASLNQNLPSLEAYAQWSNEQIEVLRLLTACVSILPSDTDWSSVERTLATLDPLAQRLRAVDGEFVFAHALYRRFERGEPTGLQSLDAQDGVRVLWEWTMRSRDELVYLRALRRHRELAPLSPAELAALPRSSETPQQWTMVALQLWSRTDVSRHPSWAVLEAHRRLARLCIACRRGGIDGLANLEAASPTARLDPFDGRPLRHRVEPNGVLTLWSIGPDLVDGSGSNAKDASGLPLDLVGKVRLP